MATVTTIPARPAKTLTPTTVRARRKVAAYARVSTDLEEQQSSYQAQIDYYTNYIQGRADWGFVGMYADEGISGTSTKHRQGFQTMITDALAGRIDLIVTKSVSRFARTPSIRSPACGPSKKPAWRSTLRRKTSGPWIRKANY